MSIACVLLRLHNLWSKRKRKKIIYFTLPLPPSFFNCVTPTSMLQFTHRSYAAFEMTFRWHNQSVWPLSALVGWIWLNVREERKRVICHVKIIYTWLLGTHHFYHSRHTLQPIDTFFANLRVTPLPSRCTSLALLHVLAWRGLTMCVWPPNVPPRLSYVITHNHLSFFFTPLQRQLMSPQQSAKVIGKGDSVFFNCRISRDLHVSFCQQRIVLKHNSRSWWT